MALYRYSRWDGSQQGFDLDEDEVMDSLADDILAHGDIDRALRSLFQRGIRGQDGQRIEGLRDLMERLRQQRQQQGEGALHAAIANCGARFANAKVE